MRSIGLRCVLQVVARWKRARASILTLPHCTAKTPMFMPVGTQGTPLA
jgi:tRNA-guanine family transglycosylase